MRKITAQEAEARLLAWAQSNAERDPLIRAAHDAGITKNRIHTLTGIARSTIDRVLAKERNA
jgi:hypothetical protein